MRNRKHFLWYNVFFSQMRHLCGSLCILVYKMLTLTIFIQNRWWAWIKCVWRFKGCYNLYCGTENIFCDITYFPHKCPTFVVPFVFWFTKMLTLTIFTQNRWWAWLKCVWRFKGCYNLYCGTENIFCDITLFSSQMRHLCGSLCILVYKNADVDNFYSKSLRSMAKLFIQI